MVWLGRKQCVSDTVCNVFPLGLRWSGKKLFFSVFQRQEKVSEFCMEGVIFNSTSKSVQTQGILFLTLPHIWRSVFDNPR